MINVNLRIDSFSVSSGNVLALLSTFAQLLLSHNYLTSLVTRGRVFCLTAVCVGGGVT